VGKPAYEYKYVERDKVSASLNNEKIIKKMRTNDNCYQAKNGIYPHYDS
jgi:hypothetical protein